MDTRGTRSRPALVPNMSSWEKRLPRTHGNESCATAWDHHEHAHLVTGPSDISEFGNDERLRKVSQPMDIKTMPPPHERIQSHLIEVLKNVGVAPMNEDLMLGIQKH